VHGFIKVRKSCVVTEKNLCISNTGYKTENLQLKHVPVFTGFFPSVPGLLKTGLAPPTESAPVSAATAVLASTSRARRHGLRSAFWHACLFGASHEYNCHGKALVEGALNFTFSVKWVMQG
jgi:hypothetical protein